MDLILNKLIIIGCLLAVINLFLSSKSQLEWRKKVKIYKEAEYNELRQYKYYVMTYHPLAHEDVKSLGKFKYI